jgi:hypothetical protein
LHGSGFLHVGSNKVPAGSNFALVIDATLVGNLIPIGDPIVVGNLALAVNFADTCGIEGNCDYQNIVKMALDELALKDNNAYKKLNIPIVDKETTCYLVKVALKDHGGKHASDSSSSEKIKIDVTVNQCMPRLSH